MVEKKPKMKKKVPQLPYTIPPLMHCTLNRVSLCVGYTAEELSYTFPFSKLSFVLPLSIMFLVDAGV